MLKKCLKGIGIVGAVYAVLEILWLAWIGCGKILQVTRDTENPTITNVNDEVVDVTMNNWKWYIGLFKREA